MAPKVSLSGRGRRLLMALNGLVSMRPEAHDGAESAPKEPESRYISLYCGKAAQV